MRAKEPAETLPGRPSALQSADVGKSFLLCVFCYRIANEKLGNKLREQVKYIAKLTGEKE